MDPLSHSTVHNIMISELENQVCFSSHAHCRQGAKDPILEEHQLFQARHVVSKEVGRKSLEQCGKGLCLPHKVHIWDVFGAACIALVTRYCTLS